MKLGQLRQDRRAVWTAASISQASLPPLPELASTSPRPRSSRRRRWLGVMTVVMALGGSLLLIDGVLTLVWQEPVSSLYAHFAQDRLNGDLRALDRAPPSPRDRRALAVLSGPGPRMALLARELQTTTRTGAAVGRIQIPHIAANFAVVAGTDVGALRKGPGIYAQTSFPGERGTVAIAGHRTTYLAPFRRINELVAGNRVSIDMPYGRFTYVVRRHQIVAPTDVGVLSAVGKDQLVLTACHPLYSAAKRWVVFASLVSSEPRGAALNPAGLTAPALSLQPLPDTGVPGMLLGTETRQATPSLAAGQSQASDLLLGLSTPVLSLAAHRPAHASTSRPTTSLRQRAPVPGLAPSRRGVAPSAPYRAAPVTIAPTPRRVAQRPTASPTPVRHPVTAPPERHSPVQSHPGGPTPVVGAPQQRSHASPAPILVGGG